MARDFKDIKSMLDYYYQGGYSNEYGGKLPVEIAKDADALTTTTGTYNPVYGAAVFTQFNNVANTLGTLKKFPMNRTGIRVISAAASTVGTGGVSEDGAIPATEKPTFAVFSRKPLEVVHSFSVSSKQELVSQMQDDAPINMEALRNYWMEEHPKRINRMFQTNVTTLASVYTSLESLDRVVSSYAEVTNCGDVDANDSDIYSLDRDAAASWSDAQVSHNSNTDRTLTLDLIRTVIRNVKNAGGTPTKIITGADTAQKIDNLLESHSRFTPTGNMTASKLTSNGVMTGSAIQGGVTVGELFGLPIIEDADCVADGASRIYVLDDTEKMGMPKLGFAVAQPTSYYEYGMSKKDPSGINRLATEAFLYTAGELHCSLFGHQGKLRDISA